MSRLKLPPASQSRNVATAVGEASLQLSGPYRLIIGDWAKTTRLEE